MFSLFTKRRQKKVKKTRFNCTIVHWNRVYVTLWRGVKKKMKIRFHYTIVQRYHTTELCFHCFFFPPKHSKTELHFHWILSLYKPSFSSSFLISLFFQSPKPPLHHTTHCHHHHPSNNITLPSPLSQQHHHTIPTTSLCETPSQQSIIKKNRRTRMKREEKWRVWCRSARSQSWLVQCISWLAHDLWESSGLLVVSSMDNGGVVWGHKEGEGEEGGAWFELRGKEIFSRVCRGH